MNAYTATGFLGIVEYLSGRRIYVGARPEIGDFSPEPWEGHAYPTEKAAADAVDELVRYFQVRDRSALKLLTEPCR